MGTICLQMIDHSVSSHWWKALVKYFVQAGDDLEIRCWKEEISEIQQALRYGKPAEERNEISIKGIVSEEFLAELLKENPTDKQIYNKMTKYFTINTNHEQRSFCSAHYGTEMYILNASCEDINFFQDVMKTHPEDFSISITEC